MWHYDNSNKPVPESIATHSPEAAQILQCMNPNPFITPWERDTEQVLFMTSGDESLGYWSRKTIHSSSHHRNDDDETSEEEGIEIS